jgi:hypothetical protein
VLPVIHAGSLTDNAKMTAIQSARKRFLHGNAIWNAPYQGSAYSFRVLLIGFYEGVRLTHRTSESGPSRYFDALRNSAAIGFIADIGRAESNLIGG